MILALLLALPAVNAVPAVRAHADLGTYFQASDYPAVAAQRGEAGTVAFTLDVDAGGRVAACHVTTSSGSQALDDATCSILSTRALFTPARDRAGGAVPDHVSDRATWNLPPEQRPTLASYISDADYPAEAIRRGEEGTVAFELDVSPQGLVAACRVTGSSGSAILDAATCRLLYDRGRFRPARNAAGKPVMDMVASRVRWVLPR